MHKNEKIPALINLAKRHMENQGFTDNAIYACLRIWRSVYHYASSRGVENFNCELATDFLRDKYQITWGMPYEKSYRGEYHRQIIRALNMLVDFTLHGMITKERGKTVEWADGFGNICNAFFNSFSPLGIEYAPTTIRQLELDLSRFISFVVIHGANVPNEITATHIYDYFKTLTHLSKSSLLSIRSTLVRALKFFYKNSVCDKDLSGAVPRIYYYAQRKLSKIWTSEEVEQILGSINRADAVGKRDYAIIAIAANLGLRAVDIIHLSINDFDWKKGVISIIQSKTGEPLSLTLSEQIGKAVIDYWQNGRPNTVANELFVQHVLPYQGLSHGMLYYMFNKYYLSADIYVPPERRRGLHSLRHSLASRLLELDTPVNIISNILGHVNSETASQYIRVDINKLRECALEVPSVE